MLKNSNAIRISLPILIIFSSFIFGVYSFGGVIYLEKSIKEGISQGVMPVRTLTDEGTRYVFMICEGSGNVLIYDKDSGTIIKSVKVGRFPWDGVLFKGMLFINDGFDKSISIVETKTFRVVKRFEGNYDGFYFSLDGKVLYFDDGGKKKKFDPGNLSLVTPPNLPPLISSKAYLTPSKMVYKIDSGTMQIEIKDVFSNEKTMKLRFPGIPTALFEYNGRLYVLDKATFTLDECKVGERSIYVEKSYELNNIPLDMTFDPLRREIYVSEGNSHLMVFDLNTLNVKKEIILGIYPTDMAFYNTHLLVLGMLSNILYDIGGRRVIHKISLPSFLPQHIVVDEKNGIAYISEFGSLVDVIDLFTKLTIRHIRLNMPAVQLAYDESKDVLYILTGTHEIEIFNLTKGFIASRHLGITPKKIITNGKDVYIMSNTSIEKYDWRLDTLESREQFDFTLTDTVLTGDSKIYVAGDGTLNVYDISTFGKKLKKTIPIEGTINTLCYYKGKLFVGEGKLRRIIVVDTHLDRIVDLIPLEREFEKMVVKGGYLYTLSTSGGYVEWKNYEEANM